MFVMLCVLVWIIFVYIKRSCDRLANSLSAFRVDRYADGVKTECYITKVFFINVLNVVKCYIHI